MIIPSLTQSFLFFFFFPVLTLTKVIFCISLGLLVTIHTSNIGSPPLLSINNDNDHKTPAPGELMFPSLGILDHPHNQCIILEGGKSIWTEINKIKREQEVRRRIVREGKISIPTISSSKAVYDKKRIRQPVFLLLILSTSPFPQTHAALRTSILSRQNSPWEKESSWQCATQLL